MPGVFYPRCVVRVNPVFDSGEDGGLTVRSIFLIPQMATVQLNGYKSADTFSLEFDARKFPFDPEIVRACEVVICMTAGDSPSDSLLDIQDPNDAVHALFADPRNIKIVGLADNINAEYTESGQVVRMDGRDYTSILIDKRWPEKRIPVGMRLDQLIQRMVDEGLSRNIADADTGTIRTVAPGRTLSVRFVGDGAATPIDGAGPRVVRGAPKVVKVPIVKAEGTSKRGVTVKSDFSYWDAIYMTCLHQGYVVYVDGLNVIISDPKTLSKNAQSRLWRFSYGANVENLRVERNMGKESVPQIVVVGYDRRTLRRLQAVYPEKMPVKKGALGQQKIEQRVYTFGGVRDLPILKRLAKLAYHQLSQGESRITFTTSDLRDLQNREVLDVKPGDPLQIDFDQSRELLRAQEPGTISARLQESGYPSDVANIVSEEYARLLRFQRPLYVREVTLRFAVDDGINVDFELLNFVQEHRDDVERFAENAIEDTGEAVEGEALV